MLKSAMAVAVAITTAVVVAATAQEKADSTAAKPAPAAPKSGPQAIIGEVVDPACYLINGAKGEPHKECALACAKSGQTLAILEKKTNKLYLLCTEKPGQDPNALAIDYVARTVVVSGHVRSRGGALGIQAASIQPAPKGAK
jgi:hypothetical protein